ncbi:MAG: uroporphyrinogen-III synthase [Crocinitomicaceae bacterium]|nr:uroporphyrinogen-III synthase [Crocinitomicaceae bacterium]
MNKGKSILVTRSLKADSLIRKWTGEKKIDLIEKSFIETVAITGLTIPETDWIFFSSPQSVNLYFAHYKLAANKVAALSNGTAAELSIRGIEVDFIGSDSKPTKEIGHDFFNQIKSVETVLFPLSDISKKNISSQVKTENVTELITYKTALVSDKLSDIPGIILFTSPSNVDGFLLSNRPELKTQILAIGETTAARLRELGMKDILVSESTNEKELVKTLRGLI